MHSGPRGGTSKQIPVAQTPLSLFIRSETAFFQALCSQLQHSIRHQVVRSRRHLLAASLFWPRNKMPPKFVGLLWGSIQQTRTQVQSSFCHAEALLVEK